MRQTIFLIVLSSLLYTLITSDQQCNTVCYSSNGYNEHQCAICFEQCEEQKQFKNCVDSHNNVDVGGVAQCIQYCCEYSQLKQFSNDVYQKCVSSSEQTSEINLKDIQTVVIIASLLVPGCFITAIICCVCRKSHNKVVIQQRDQNNMRNQDKYRESVEQISKQNAIIEIQLVHTPQKFTKLSQENINNSDMQDYKQNQKSLCSICFESKTNCRAQCNHAFHINCILQKLLEYPSKLKCPYLNQQEEGQISIENISDISSEGSDMQSPKNKKILTTFEQAIKPINKACAFKIQSVRIVCQKCRQIINPLINLNQLKENLKHQKQSLCTQCKF